MRALWCTTHQHAGVLEVAVGVEFGVGLRDNELFFFVSCEVNNFARDPSVFDLAVRRLDEAELVDTCVGSKVTDQTNVWAFRRFDRAHAAVVRRVNVTNFEARTLT